jgi:hypothetical protein
MKKLILLFLPLLLIFTGCGKPVDTGVGQRFCSITHGFNFFTPGVARIGYITYLKIGGVEYAPDFEVTDPVHSGNKITVFGVASWLAWKGNQTDAVVFAAQVSGDNEQKLLELGKNDLTGIAIEFSFALYDFDSKANAYFISLSSNSQILSGTLDEEGGHLLYYMSNDTGVEVATPPNYNFQLGVKPDATPQKLQTAQSAGKSSLKIWGGK